MAYKKDILTNESNPLQTPGRVHVLIMAGIAVVIWLFLKVCLNNQFTNWDDPSYITSNPLIKDISPGGLKAIFSTPVVGNYHPLTILTYALEYSAAALNPWLYHFDSLLLHIFVTLLVYWLVYLLTRRPIAAVITALLFGLHPMHMESMAWISGRKDLLYGLFYLGACIAYVYFTRENDSKKTGWYIGSIALFIFALLSKPVAVTLPLTLLLIDYFEKRTWSRKTMLDKIPYFILALICGLIAFKVQRDIGAVDLPNEHFNAIERTALGAYALITYLWKAVLPADLLCFYPYPPKTGGSLPSGYYLYPLAVAAIIFITWKYARKNRVVMFGLLYFIAGIALLLQFIPVGQAILADRYTYLPYFGLFFIAGWYVSSYFEPGANKQTGYVVFAATLLFTGCLGYLSNQRCMVWYDSLSLWRDEIAKEPERAPIAYNNLGFIYFDKWYNATGRTERETDYDSALYLMSRYAVLQPDSAGAYQGLSMLYYSKKNYAAASACYKTALRLHPTPEGYSNYGNFLELLGKPDSALLAYDTALSQNPEMYAPYLNRGKILKQQNRWAEAMRDFNQAIELNPNNGESYYQRSFCDTQSGLKFIAFRDVNQAISLGYKKVDSAYYNSLKR